MVSVKEVSLMIVGSVVALVLNVIYNKSYVNENLTNWDGVLPQMQFAYNSAINSTTGFSPFFLATGRVPKMPLDLIYPDANLDLNLNPGSYADNLSKSLTRAFEFIIKAKVNVVNIDKINHKRVHRACKLEVNDRVWLYESNSAKDNKGKFRKKWVGPFTVMGVLNEVNYIIKQDDKKKTRVVHRDRLQRCIAKASATANDLNVTANTPIVKRKRQVRQPIQVGEMSVNVSNEQVIMENKQEVSVSDELLAITNGEEVNASKLSESSSVLLENLDDEETDDEIQVETNELEFEDEFELNRNADDEYVPAITQFINFELDALMGGDESVSSNESEDENDEFKLNYYHENKLKQQATQHNERPKRNVARPKKYSK